MVTFDDARAKVAAATGKPAADYGWENDDVFLVAIDYGGALPRFDGPDHLVDKRTGQFRKVYGMLGHDPVPNLQPINNPPDADA